MESGSTFKPSEAPWELFSSEARQSTSRGRALYDVRLFPRVLHHWWDSPAPWCEVGSCRGWGMDEMTSEGSCLYQGCHRAERRGHSR